LLLQRWSAFVKSHRTSISKNKRNLRRCFKATSKTWEKTEQVMAENP